MRAPLAVALHRHQRLRRPSFLSVLPLLGLFLTGEIIGRRRDGRPIYPISGAALVCTQKAGVANTTGGTSLGSGTFTPTAGSLLIVFGLSTATTTGQTMTDSQSLGWTRVATALFNTSASNTTAWVSNKFAAASSMTCTYGTTSATGCGIMVYEVTGMTRTGWSAVRQVAITQNQGTSTPAPSFSNVCLTGNATLGLIGSQTNSAISPPVSWTETASIGDLGFNSPATRMEAVARNSGFTAAQITWGGSVTGWNSIIIELDSTTQTSVQSNANTGTASSTTVACTYQKAVVSGHALWCLVYWNSATDTCTVADSVNGSWTAWGSRLVGAGTQAAWSIQAFYKLSTGAGTPVVTATFQNARTDYGIAIHEAIAASVDATAAAYSNYSGTTPTTSSWTNTAAHCYVAAAGFFGGSNPRQIGGGFTVEEYAGFTNNTTAAESISSVAAQACTFGTVTSQNVMTFIGGFTLDATATLTTVGGVGSVPSATTTAGATTAPAAVVGVGAVPAVSVDAGTSPDANATLATVAGIGTVPSVTTTAGAATALSTVAGVGSVPAVTTTAGATATPATVAGVGSVPAVTVTAGATKALATVVGIGTVPAVTTTAGAATTVATVVGIGSVPSVSVTAGATAALTTVTGMGAVPSVTTTAGATTALTTVAGIGSVPSVTVAAGAATAVATVAGVGMIPSVGFTAGATMTLAVIAGVGSVPAVTTTAGATATLETVAALGTVPALSVTVAGNATVSLETVAGVGTIPAVITAAGAIAGLATIAGRAVIPSVTVTAGASTTIATVAGVGTVPSVAVTVAGDATILLATVDGLGAVQAVTVTAGASAGLARVAGRAVIPSLTVSAAAVTALATVAGIGSVPALVLSIVVTAEKLFLRGRAAVLGEIGARSSSLAAYGVGLHTIELEGEGEGTLELAGSGTAEIGD